jgi:hypothetical protein
MRLLLLVGPTLDEFFVAALKPVLEAPEIDVVGACVDSRPPTPLTRRLSKALRKGRGGYVLVMAAAGVRRRLGPPEEPSEAFLRAHGVDVWPVDDLYAPATLDRIRDRAPDCIFRSGFGIIKPPVLSLAPHGVLSYHHGDMRRYRGQPVAFWELYRGERTMGVTLQVLNEELDAGRIVLERAVEIRTTDTWRELERRVFAASPGMLYEGCMKIARNGFEPAVLGADELGDLYTLPNLRQWLTLQARVLARRVRSRPRSIPTP